MKNRFARVAATEKSRLASEEKIRLVAEGAKADELVKATSRVKAAEEARLAAEKAKELDEVRVAIAEKAKTASEDGSAALEKAATEKAASEIAKAEKANGEKAEAADRNAKTLLPDVAVLTPPVSDDPASSPVVSKKLNRELQTELHRVGCHTGTINDEWNAASRRAIEQFNKRARMQLEMKVASLDSLDAVRGKTTRICPLECGANEVEKNGQCVKRNEPGTASLEKPERKESGAPSAIKRAESAQRIGAYRSGDYYRPARA